MTYTVRCVILDERGVQVLSMAFIPIEQKWVSYLFQWPALRVEFNERVFSFCVCVCVGGGGAPSHIAGMMIRDIVACSLGTNSAMLPWSAILLS